MAFVNLSLLLGTVLIGIPIALHLVMRRKPKHLVFPAIRFIQQRQETNRRTLRVRHFLLLLLRCLAVALAALALARPSVASSFFGNWLIIAALALLVMLIGVLLLASLFTRQSTLLLASLAGLGLAALGGLLAMLVGTLRESDASMIGDREAPIAAVMLIDSSPRMRYRHENRTRIEQAQEVADYVVRQLPPESRVAVLDSRDITPAFSLDLGSARETLQRVKSTGTPAPLGRLLEKSLQLLEQSNLKRKEIYVYTDLTDAAWQVGDPQRLRRKFEEASQVALYLVDVGVESPQNFALGELELSQQTLAENSKLTIRTTLANIGKGGKRSVELYLEDIDPTLPVVRDGEVVLPPKRLHSRQEIELEEDSSREIEFVVSGLGLGMRNAELRVGMSDALVIDNARYASVNVRPPWPVLVAAPSEVNSSALVEAIAPYEHRVSQRAIYDCRVITTAEIPNQGLEDFAAVVLLDPPPLPTRTWEQLATYVRSGGGLAVFLGHNAGADEEFNTSAATELLPGKLGRKYRVGGRDVYLAPHSYDHPVLRPFREMATSVPWDRFPVYRHWSLREVDPDADVILRFGNNEPALLERPVSDGTVLMMTTPITEPPRPPGRQAWNELAGMNDWPRFILVNELMRFLTQQEGGNYNYQTGQSVVLANPPGNNPGRYLLFTPDGYTQPVQAREEQLVISTTEQPGTYRLKGRQESPMVRGFSVNLPRRASRLQRASEERFAELFGADRYQLAGNRDEIEREQGELRSGREFFPLLLIVLAVTLILEQLLANRFYRDTNLSAA